MRFKVTSRKLTMFLLASIVILRPFDLNTWLTSCLFVCLFVFFNFFRSGLADCETTVTVQANFIFEFAAFGCYEGHYSVLRAHGDIKHVVCVLLGPWRVLVLKE